MGFAKAQFLEIYQQAPWEDTHLLQVHWPFLETLVKQQQLSYLDYILAQKILERETDASQEIALGVCHLILATKMGHLCVSLQSQQLLPSVQLLWQTEHLFSREDLLSLEQMIVKGLTELPKSVVTNIKQASTLPYTPICRYQHLFYLQRYWVFETLILEHILRLCSSKPRFFPEQAKMDEQLLLLKDQLMPEQFQSILKGCLKPFSIITGGPGTGKTYTAGYLIKTLWHALSKEQQALCHILIAAPTGKAAAQLEQSLKRAMQDVPGFPVLKGHTLHSLLKLKQDERTLFGDLILIDESSMMDAKLMATLLSSIQTGSRLILMGDRYQLPAVEAGSLFADLIDLQTVMSIPCTSLQTSLRTDSQSILDLAKAINQGHTDQALAFFNRPEYPHLVYTDIPTTKKEFLTLLAQRLEPYYLSTNQNHLVEEILVNFNQCKILSPMRKGPFGIDAINQFLYHHFSHLHQKWLTIPILITANDYRRELFNGETGLLIRHFKQGQLPDSLQPEDYALFATRDGTHSRRLPAFLLPPYEYAYCLSVHKSQGSEFKHVILIMPEGAEVFGREVLYTAVTRARQSIEIFSYPHILHETMAHVANRFSGIQHRLNCRHI